MNICFFASSNSIHSLKWIKYFSGLGYKITWISLDKRSVEIPDNIEYHELTNNILFSIFKMKNILSGIKPDILHVHYLGTYALLALFSGVKNIVSTPWGSDIIYGKKHFIKKQIVSKILNKSKLITCDAYHMKDEILDLKIPENKIQIINFGIDTKRFTKNEKDKNLLKSLNILEEKTVLSMRNFEEVYDVKTLLFAAKIVLKEIPNIKFLFLGRGGLEKDLKGLAKKLSINNSVCFLGHLDNTLLSNLLNSIDIYVSTSLSDAGIAASTAEAMACEVPVVITDSGENNRWVQSGVNGFLVPVSDPAKLADELIKMFKNKSLMSEIGKSGREIIIDKNDIYNEMNKMNNLYKKVIN